MIRGTTVRSAAKLAAPRRMLLTATGVTKFTTLSNGVTVATETNPHATAASVGLYYGAGLRSEHTFSNGISALTNNILASKATPGVSLAALNAREYNGVIAQVTNDNVALAAETLSEIINHAPEVVAQANFGAEKAKLTAEAAAVENDPNAKVASHLVATAYQGYSLGLPIHGTPESIPGLQVEDAQRVLDKQLVSANTVVAAAGNINHDQLVESLERNLKISQGLKPATQPATFLGSEVRMRDDTMPKAYISIGVNGEALNSPEYYVAKVAANVFNLFNQDSTVAHYTSPKLASIVQEYHIVDKYTHFSHSFADAGLWGFQAEISNVGSIDDFVHFTLKQWNRLSTTIGDAEIARAKNQTKVEILAALNTPNAVANDIASKILLAGYRNSVHEALEQIDAINTEKVKQWGRKKLWDKDIVISGTGQIEDLFDYNRNRNEMAALRF